MAADPTQLPGRGRPPGSTLGTEPRVGYHHVSENVTDTVALRYDVLAQRVAHWMFTNPGQPLTKCARALNVTPQYLYYFVASDTFKAKYAELSQGEFKEAMVGTLAERLRGAAFQAIDQLTEQMQLNPGNEMLLDASELLINAAVKMDAPAAKGTSVQINNFPAIPADVVHATRESMLRGATVNPATVEGSSVQVSEDAGLPAPK